MMDALAFPSGRPPARPGPLARFLPPLDAATARRPLKLSTPADASLSAPFGATHRLADKISQNSAG